jgi:hypothetical protein
MSITIKQPIFAVLFAALATLSLLYFGALMPEVLPGWISVPWTGNSLADAKLKYQVVTFGIALAVLGITYILAPQNSRRFYRLGNLNAPAAPIRWLDVKPTDRWGKVGGTFVVIVSLATGAFIYFNLVQGKSLTIEISRLLPFILILAAMNAFTEEAITRLSVVAALDGLIARHWIYIISALIFGIPHYFGVPGGVVGSLMAGFLGWLLAKSIAETEGMGWAWFIHFLQDILIFAGLFLTV